MAAAARSCDARQHGAKGDGKTNDVKHLQVAFDDPSCGTVVLTKGHTFLSSALRVRRSNLTVTIDEGTTLKGKAGSGEADWKGWCSFLTVHRRVQL